jgi:hypothetical protein
MRRLVLNLALLAVSIVIGLTLVEGVLRLLGRYPSFSMPDRTIGFRLRPSARYRWIDEGFSTGRINAAGWRDRDYAETKPPGTTRILFIGDSYVEALQVPLDSTFHKRLERALNARASGPRYEVPALGRSGMGNAEEYLVYKKWGVRYDPDVVAVLFVLNDFIENTKAFDPHSDIRPFFVMSGDSLLLDTSFVNSPGFRSRRRIDFLKEHSSIVSVSTKMWNEIQLRRLMARSRQGAAPEDVSFDFDARLPADSLPAFQITARVLAQFAHDVQRDGRRFVLFVAGAAKQEDRTELARARRSPAFDPDKPQRFLLSVGAREGFEVVPLTPAFRAASAAGGGPYWYRARGSYGHWNATGHALAAHVMEAYLAEHDIAGGR